MAGDKNKKKVSDEVLKSMICELLDKGERGATNFYGLLRTHVQLSKARCLEIYPVVELEWITARNEVVEGVRAQEQAEAAKNGLLSDLELEIILCQYASNNVKVEDWVSGEVVLRGVTPNEGINAIRTLFAKRGSNAPSKVAATNAAGQDVAPITQVQIVPPPKIDED